MTKRNLIATGLNLVSLGLLVPGLTKTALTISASISFLGKEREIFRQSQSIFEAVERLYHSGNLFVAGLILLFSITVPFVKVILVAVILSMRASPRRDGLYNFVRSVSKWSMADVFAVGVFIAFLAAVATDNLHAVAGPGFYYFAAYCLLSNLAFQLLSIESSPTTRAGVTA